jgi:hypothetical protein
VASLTRQLKEILKGHGCYLYRQGKGDHEIWHSRFVVDGNIKSRHTANAVLKQAGIDKKI